MEGTTLTRSWPVVPSYELFFSRLEAILNPEELERVGFAYVCSKYGHAGQKRIDGSRYFDHPKAAAWIFIEELGGRDADTMILCLIHDLSEGAYLLSPYRIKVNFGEDIAFAVRGLTKLKSKKEPHEEYLLRVNEQGPRTIVSKLCDRLHNLRTLEACGKEMQEEQITETKHYHLPILIPALVSHGGIWAEYAQKLAMLIYDAMLPYEQG